jgi:hypothetical protein
MKKYLLFAILAVCILVLYPREVVLIPAIEITLRYEGGDPVAHGEISRNWNHYLGDGWKASIVRTDENGKAKFVAVKKRVPMLLQGLKVVFSIPGHYYPGLAGSFVGRDSNNHFIWQRIDFNGSNCCPTEIVISLHETEDQVDKYFTFGEVVPNE